MRSLSNLQTSIRPKDSNSLLWETPEIWMKVSSNNVNDHLEPIELVLKNS